MMLQKVKLVLKQEIAFNILAFPVFLWFRYHDAYYCVINNSICL